MAKNVYGLDLGSYEIKVYDKKSDTIWKEKNVIAIKEDREIFAVGDQAYEMYEKTPPDIQVQFPMENGVISRFNDMQYLLQNLLKKERHFARGSAYESPFYGRIIGKLEELLRKKGYYIMIFSDKNVEEIEKMTLGWNVDGIISISMPFAYCKKISGLSDKPMVSIDMGEIPKEEEKFYLVTSEDEKAGAEMSEYLISNGTKKIIYLANAVHGADYRRYQGVKKTADRKSCELEMKLLPTETEGRQMVYGELLKYAGTDTTLLFSTDKNAAEMISFLHRNDVKVPEDISVAGIDDDVFATIVYPTITTMKIDVEEKANMAVEILMRLIQGESCMPYIYKTKVQLIERESVKKR